MASELPNSQVSTRWTAWALSGVFFMVSCADDSAIGRIDPLVATTDEMVIAIEAEVESLPTPRERLVRRMAVAEELIEARAAAEGRLPSPDSPAADWQRFHDTYAPLRAALLDESMSESDVRELIRQDAELAYATPPSPDDLRLSAENERLYGVTAEEVDAVDTEGEAR